MKKTVLVTGTTSGIGLCFVSTYVRKGWNVISVNRRKCPELEKKFPTVQFHQIDISNYSQVSSLLNQLVEQDGVPDVFILNAGINRPDNAPTFDYETFHSVMSTNLDGVLTFVGAIQKSKLTDRTIFGLSSTSNIVANPGHVSYFISKVALLQAFRLFAKRDRKNRYKSVILGPVRTNIAANYVESQGLQAKLFQILSVSPQQFVDACIKFLDQSKQLLYFPRAVVLFYYLVRCGLSFFPGVYQGTVTRPQQLTETTESV